MAIGATEHKYEQIRKLRSFKAVYTGNIVIGQVCSAVFLHCCNGIGLGMHICKLLSASSLLMKSLSHKSHITPSVKPLTPGKRENKLTIVPTCISAQGDGGATSCYCTRHSSTLLQTKTTATCLRIFVTH
ncbi:unnamed protein product [Ixodes pacificus]